MNPSSALQNRHNWVYEAFIFDAGLLIAAAAAIVHSLRSACSSSPRTVLLDRRRAVLSLTVAILLIGCPCAALATISSHWSVHYADYILQIVCLAAHAGACAYFVAAGVAEPLSLKSAWVLALVLGLPRLASSTKYGTEAERACVSTSRLQSYNACPIIT